MARGSYKESLVSLRVSSYAKIRSQFCGECTSSFCQPNLRARHPRGWRMCIVVQSHQRYASFLANLTSTLLEAATSGRCTFLALKHREMV